VFARAAAAGDLLTKDHVFGGESSDLNQQLAGSRALNAPVKQSAFATRSALGLAGWRTKFLLAPFFFSAIFAPAFLGGQVEIVVFHRILHVE
jgi:hypothetical protein